ncbi:MAG: hypothetical protein IPP30_06195 [Flavobacterium sp.]|nr:hypothetical protein [Flavobacterium sp.]
MQVKLKFGIDKLLFGMKEADVRKIYGAPDKQFKDEDKNIILVYNALQLRLTFYEDEDLRLGYLISSNPKLTIFEKVVIDETVEDVKMHLEGHQLRSWEKEDFDLTENHFNEENWLILQSEFGRIVKVEIGAIIKNEDDFDWKFNA